MRSLENLRGTLTDICIVGMLLQELCGTFLPCKRPDLKSSGVEL